MIGDGRNGRSISFLSAGTACGKRRTSPSKENGRTRGPTTGPLTLGPCAATGFAVSRRTTANQIVIARMVAKVRRRVFITFCLSSKIDRAGALVIDKKAARGMGGRVLPGAVKTSIVLEYSICLSVVKIFNDHFWGILAFTFPASIGKFSSSAGSR